MADLDRVFAVDRALDDIRAAERLMPDLDAVGSWRGPAQMAFTEASGALVWLLHSAGAALERERERALAFPDPASADS
jgi:hypothetical protein